MDMNRSKVAVAVSKTVSFVQMLAGVAIVLLFGFCTVMYLTDREFAADTGAGFLIFCLVLDALGVWLLVLSRKKTKLVKEFKRYVAVVSNDPDGCIPNIAAALGTSENVVRKKLELMIRKKYFANAFIDQNLNRIVVATKQNAAVSTAQRPQTNAPVMSQAVEMVTVKCKGCGGINTLQKGVVGECDYCGSSIKGE